MPFPDLVCLGRGAHPYERRSGRGRSLTKPWSTSLLVQVCEGALNGLSVSGALLVVDVHAYPSIWAVVHG